jgi:hypothetical protein
VTVAHALDPHCAHAYGVVAVVCRQQEVPARRSGCSGLLQSARVYAQCAHTKRDEHTFEQVAVSSTQLHQCCLALLQLTGIVVYKTFSVVVGGRRLIAARGV